MHKLRSSGGRRGIGVHVARIAAFSAALIALTGIVVADVLAAELEVTEASIAGDDWEAEASGPALLAVVVPDAPEALPAMDLPLEPMEPPQPRKKRRAGKLKFGRFDGY